MTTITRWTTVKDVAGGLDGYPWAVVDADNDAVAFFADEASALTLIKHPEIASATDELIVELGGKPKPGSKKDKRLKENEGGRTGKTAKQADVTALESVQPNVAPQWRGVLAVEGSPTGDGREFAPDSLSWPDPIETTLTLQWQKESSHGGVPTDVTVAVGRIDRVWRDGGNIMGEGRFDTHPDAVEAQRRMGEGMLNGTSINADDITDADIEYVFPESDGEDEEDDLLMMLFAQPEKVIFHAARLRATTLCDIPAFVEATLHTVDEGDALVASAIVVTEPHSTATTDVSWDGPINEARLPDVLTEEQAATSYAYVEPGVLEDEISKSDVRFLHHEVDEHGVSGAANLTACSTGIGVLHGGRGGTNLSASARRDVYAHLAKHLRDAGQEPPPYQPPALVAHAWTDTWRPPAQWFTNPNLGQVMPIVVTDQGRVYGYAAQYGECHMGYLDECIMVPRDDDFSRYLTGEQPLDDGTRTAVGVITAGLSHAPLHYGANKASDHYDNTNAQIAYITAGYDRQGIWVAGAVLPWAEEARVSALRATGQVSPDWRRIGGKLKMIGLLAVNESGYQTPKGRVLVASGEVQAFVASGMVTVQHQSLSEHDLNQRALRLMREQLAQRVHPA